MADFETLLVDLIDIRVLLVAASLTAFLTVLGGYFPRLSGRPSDLSATQSMHRSLTPRVGGLGIFLPALVAGLMTPGLDPWAAAGFVAALAILFAVGLCEDLGFHVAPGPRLLVAVGTTVLVMLSYSAWLPKVDLPILDLLLAHWFLGGLFTILIVAGVTNAFNLIDGVHGLAAFTGIVGALALSVIAMQTGADTLATLGVILATAILGFFILNYPFGLIFLGDAGAYSIGFALAWLGVALINVDPSVTPWAILLTVFWPMADTVFAMYRRLRRNRALMQPDRMHAHQLVLRGLEILLLGRDRRRLANPLTTAVLSPFIVVPPIAGILLWNQPGLALLAVLCLLAAYIASFGLVTRLVRRRALVRTVRQPVMAATRRLLAPVRGLDPEDRDPAPEFTPALAEARPRQKLPELVD